MTASPWDDRAYLREVQYRTDANLAARQSIYAYQQPPIDLISRVLDDAALAGDETIADIGCGNGKYLAALAARGHQGHLLGADMSPGMLAAVRTPAATLIVADATALPLRDATADVTLAMHMLYHVPSPADAVRELHRITRPGGHVLVALNAEDHLLQLGKLIAAALADVGAPALPLIHDSLTLDRGEALLRTEFSSVTRQDFISELVIADSAPVIDYVSSMSLTKAHAAPDRLTSSITHRFHNDIAAPLRITTHSGCLVCT
jgi:SAM-dependent methyltransferase